MLHFRSIHWSIPHNQEFSLVRKLLPTFWSHLANGVALCSSLNVSKAFVSHWKQSKKKLMYCSNRVNCFHSVAETSITWHRLIAAYALPLSSYRVTSKISKARKRFAVSPQLFWKATYIIIQVFKNVFPINSVELSLICQQRSKQCPWTPVQLQLDC